MNQGMRGGCLSIESPAESGPGCRNVGEECGLSEGGEMSALVVGDLNRQVWREGDTSEGLPLN